MIHRVLAGTALLLCAPAWSADAPATTIDYGLRGGLSYSDNVLLAQDGAKRDATSIFAGVQLNGARPAGRLRYDMGVDLTASKYLNENVNQTLRGNASLRGSYDFVPETFGWTASLAYDQYREDLLRALGPGNTDEIVSFSTGPTARLRFSDRIRAELDATYSRINYSDRPHDSENLGGRVTLLRQVGARLAMGLGVSANDVSYLESSPGLIDYNRRELFVTTTVKGVRTDAGLEVGYSQIKDEASSDSSGLLFRGNLSRRLTPSLSASISAVREFTIAGIYDDFPRAPGIVGEDETPITAGARLTRGANLGLNYQRQRTAVSFALSRREENGEFSGAGKRKYNLVSGRVSRRFTQQLQGSVDATLTSEKFSIYTSKANDNLLGAELNWTVGRALSLGLRLDRRSRDAVFAAGDYSEFRGSLYVNYGRRSGF